MAHPVSHNLSTCLCKGVEEGGVFGGPVVGVVDEPEVLHHRAVQKSWNVLVKSDIIYFYYQKTLIFYLI
jgi:hypothetical protein